MFRYIDEMIKQEADTRLPGFSHYQNRKRLVELRVWRGDGLDESLIPFGNNDLFDCQSASVSVP